MMAAGESRSTTGITNSMSLARNFLAQAEVADFEARRLAETLLGPFPQRASETATTSSHRVLFHALDKYFAKCLLRNNPASTTGYSTHSSEKIACRMDRLCPSLIFMSDPKLNPVPGSTLKQKSPATSWGQAYSCLSRGTMGYLPD